MTSLKDISKIEHSAFFRLLCFLLITLPSAKAQSTIDYDNIFSLHHNRVGVPKDTMLYLYSVKQKDWAVTDSIPLPENYIALDGNIRRVYVLMDDAMVFHGFYGESNDTIHFNDTIHAPKPTNWIRTPYSTEKDFWVYESGREIGYVKDGEEWYKIDMHDRLAALFENASLKPLLDEHDVKSVSKLYSFGVNSGDHMAAIRAETITFHRHELETDYMEAIRIDFEERHGYPYPKEEEMEFQLDTDAISAFVYDQRHIAVVHVDKIRFYEYDFSRKRWIQSPHHPDLVF